MSAPFPTVELAEYVGDCAARVRVPAEEIAEVVVTAYVGAYAVKDKAATGNECAITALMMLSGARVSAPFEEMNEVSPLPPPSSTARSTLIAVAEGGT